MKTRRSAVLTGIVILAFVLLYSFIPIGGQPLVSPAVGASYKPDRPISRPGAIADGSFILPASLSLGVTIYVDVTNNSGFEDGTLEHPFNTIQEGINAASSGDTIQVAPGTYFEKITLVNGIRLLGSGRKVTIIDGTDQDDSVVSASGITVETLVQGFTITHGTGKHVGPSGYTYGGGVFATNSTLVFRDILFIDNGANDGTGGLQVEFSNTIIDHCLFQDNHGWWGGSISIHGGSATVKHTLLTGSASYYGGAFFITTAAQVTSLNNIITHTSQPPAIGIADAASATITNNTIVDNYGNGIATGVYLVGGGTGTAIISNTILWDNNDDLVNLEATYSNIEDGDLGLGNLSVDPLFVDLENHDYHLLKASPSVDSGTNIGAPGNDYENDPRPVDGNGDGNSVADMGADEYYPLEVVKEADNIGTLGNRLDYEITLDNTYPMTLTNVQVTDTLPLLVTYVEGSLTASTGDFGYSTGVITWTGTIPPGALVTIHYGTRVNSDAPVGAELKNTAVIQETGRVITRTETVTVDYNFNFMPILHRPPPGIHGHVSINGMPANSVWLDLRFYNGTSWITRDSTTVWWGEYSFPNAPSLLPGQRYYVRFLNEPFTGQLWLWATRVLTSYTAGTFVNIGNFDIGDVPLVYPPHNASVNVPVTFRWTPRSYSRTDNYEFNLYDPYDLDPYIYPVVGYSGSYTLNSLPPGFNVGDVYTWELWIYSPDGGYGISFEYRDVYFNNYGLSGMPLDMQLREKILSDVEMRRLR